MDKNIFVNKMVKRILNLVLLICLLIAILYVCGNESEYLVSEDFKSIKKIDAHVHYHTEEKALAEQAKEDNFRLITMNTRVEDFPSIDKQRHYALYLMKAFPGIVFYATSFDLEEWDEPEWIDRTINYIKNSFDKGAIAAKIWKDIGMVLKDKNGKFIMVDDPIFDPIFKYIRINSITLTAHIAEPKNCWLPLEEMTVNIDRDYFKTHPQYHMYLHSEYPSYEELIESRDIMLKKNPNIRFAACHFASLEWSIKMMSAFLNEFPNAAVDMAARLSHIQYLTMKERENVRDFFIEYQNRILYGTDLLADGSENTEKLKDNAHMIWLTDWKYFVSDEVMSSPNFDGEFRGLKLPKTVVEKIYRNNAEKWYPDIKWMRNYRY